MIMKNDYKLINTYDFDIKNKLMYKNGSDIENNLIESTNLNQISNNSNISNTPKIPQNLHPIIINIDTFFNIYIYKY